MSSKVGLLKKNRSPSSKLKAQLEIEMAKNANVSMVLPIDVGKKKP